jgi:hypothetical protein
MLPMTNADGTDHFPSKRGSGRMAAGWEGVKGMVDLCKSEFER